MMISVSRRDTLKLGLGTAAVAAIAGTGAILANSKETYKAIYDTRFQSGRDFADILGGRGVNAFAIQGDVTNLWYQDLYHAWKKPDVKTIGMTLPQSLQALEIMASQQGKKITFCEEITNANNARTREIANLLLTNTNKLKNGPVTAPMMGRQNLIIWEIA